MYNYENQVIEGDSISILPQIPNDFANLIIVDPPYYTACQQLWPERFKTMAEYLIWYEKWLSELDRILVDNGSLYVFVPPLEFAEVHLLIKKFFKQNAVISWVKRNVMIRQPTARTYFPKTEFVGFYTRYNEKKYTWNSIAKVFGLQKACNFALNPTIHRRVGEGVNHPTQKPLKLCAKFVHASSNVGDVVLDPFCGSGTTLLAAKLLDRKFLGIELNPEYSKLSRRRVDQHSIENLSEKKKGSFF